MKHNRALAEAAAKRQREAEAAEAERRREADRLEAAARARAEAERREAAERRRRAVRAALHRFGYDRMPERMADLNTRAMHFAELITSGYHTPFDDLDDLRRAETLIREEAMGGDQESSRSRESPSSAFALLSKAPL